MLLDKGYETHTSYHCLIGCVENYCIFQNVPISGADIFFYVNGFKLKYSYIEDKVFDLSSYLDYKKGFRELGIVLNYYVMRGENEDVKNKLISFVEEEKMILIKMDTSKIDYDIIFSKNQQTYHSFNVIAYDYQNDSFCISDSFIPAYEPFSKQLWISSNVLLTAWENCREYWLIEFLEGCFKNTVNTCEKIIEQLEWYLNGRNEGRVYLGKTSIRQLISEFKQNVLLEWNVQSVIDFNFQLRVNGFLMGREFLSVYLNKNDEGELAEKVYEIVNQWKKMSMSLTKCVMRKNEDRLSQRVNEMNSLCDMEENVFMRIVERLKEYH